MAWSDHARTTGSALKNWFVAQCYDSAAVAGLWLIGLLIIRVPLTPLWALLAGVLQFVPHIGPPIALVFPVIAGFWTQNHWGSMYVLILYAVVMVLDGFVLQPWIMKRTAKVPFWASLLTPIVIMLLIPTWWAILLAPPLLAVVFAFRKRTPSAKNDLASGE